MGVLEVLENSWEEGGGGERGVLEESKREKHQKFPGDATSCIVHCSGRLWVTIVEICVSFFSPGNVRMAKPFFEQKIRACSKPTVCSCCRFVFSNIFEKENKTSMFLHRSAPRLLR